MKIGLDVAQQRLPWSEIVGRARFADTAGFDGLWGFDHFQPMYGSGPGECFEGYTTLAALTGVTERVRLGLLVSGVTYRPPALVAMEALTIDHASDGRLNLALGSAWFAQEHETLGIPFPSAASRTEMLDEAVQVIRGLLTEDDFSFEGRYYTVRSATFLPRPVQRPHPPIWIGARGERRMLPLVARYADVWHAFGTVEELAAKSRVLDDLAIAAGREPAAIVRAASISLDESLDDVRRQIEAWRAAGFQYLIAGWPSVGKQRVDEFVSDVLPECSE